MTAKPMRAKVRRALAPAAASGLPEDVMNWMPEMMMIIIEMKPAIAKMAGKMAVMNSPKRLLSVNLPLKAAGLPILSRQSLKPIHWA